MRTRLWMLGPMLVVHLVRVSGGGLNPEGRGLASLFRRLALGFSPSYPEDIFRIFPVVRR